MKEIYKTKDFLDYIDGLRDALAKEDILTRIDRLSMGNAGDYKRLGEELRELRIRTSKGYRVYYAENDDSIVILWAGHKGTQTRDIKKAKELAKEGNEQWHLK